MPKQLSKSEIDHYLYEVAKEYKKTNRTNPHAELILVGGGAIMLGYNFRNTTEDLDAIIRGSSSLIKEVANHVGDKNGLANGWLNSEFSKTNSYSKELVLHSKFYKTFCNCLEVRIVPDEYLIAMKMVSGRAYKHDRSDIIGILTENYQKQTPISKERIEDAVKELYGNLDTVSEKMWQFLNDVLKVDDLEELYYQVADIEKQNKSALTAMLKEQPELNTNIETALSYLDDFHDVLDYEERNITLGTSNLFTESKESKSH